jgi:hypothetical protein
MLVVGFSARKYNIFVSAKEIAFTFWQLCSLLYILNSQTLQVGRRITYLCCALVHVI